MLERAGHTEGSVDIAKLAGFSGSGVICEIMNDDGTMARMSDLEVLLKSIILKSLPWPISSSTDLCANLWLKLLARVRLPKLTLVLLRLKFSAA